VLTAKKKRSVCPNTIIDAIEKFIVINVPRLFLDGSRTIPFSHTPAKVFEKSNF
jgi:hypothetical protein